MRFVKIVVVLVFACIGLVACFGKGDNTFVIAESKTYEATLFRQNCAICHGPEGDGKTLDDGTIVPSLRKGEFKTSTSDQIYKQIADGGNGMLPFRRQLTDREIKLLVDLVSRDLRSK